MKRKGDDGSSSPSKKFKGASGASFSANSARFSFTDDVPHIDEEADDPEALLMQDVDPDSLDVDARLLWPRTPVTNFVPGQTSIGTPKEIHERSTSISIS